MVLLLNSTKMAHKKFETTSTGIDVTGAITSTGKVQAGDDVEVVVSSD